MESPNAWTERHSRLVVESAPTPAEATEPELARAWNVIQQEVQPSAVRRRPSTRLVVGAVLTAASLTVGGVAAATALSAHTHEYPVDAQDVGMGGPGELLNPVASDFGDVITEVTADIPFPNDAARAGVHDFLAADAGDAGSGESVRESTGAVRAWAAQGAVCAWGETWAGASADGDTDLRQKAARMLHAASLWPAVTDIDPVQKAHTSKMKVRDAHTGKVTSGIADDSTQFAYLIVVQKAADGTSLHAMDTALAKTFCYGVSTPHLPLTAESNR